MCENPVKEDESEISVDDVSEPSDNHTEEVDLATAVTEPNGKSEVNIEAEPNHIYLPY